MVPLTEFKKAKNRIESYVTPSPLRYSNWLSQNLNAEVYLKLECLQPGRSFKIRGATNTLLSQDKTPTQVLTASGGNHGLGVAIASKRLNIPCKVVLPTSTSKYRIDLLKQHGAEVELHGDAWDDANKFALNLARKEDILYIHPFADRSVMIGQGTISLELEKQLGNYDLIMASVGGGGLLGGISLAIEALGKHETTEIYAVETKGADSLAQSIEKKELVELPSITSIAKTLGAKKTTQFILETMQRLLSGFFVIDDKYAVQSMVSFLDNEKLLVEPATSCIISAALQNPKVFENKKCVLVICGSNVTYNELMQWQKQYEIDILNV